MSNKHLFLPFGFPRANLQNGLGRYVCQLQRITIKYCKSSGDSKGIRDFLENQLLDFSTKNPGVVVYVKPRRHRQPVLVGEYLNGDRHWLKCRSYTEEQFTKWIETMVTQNKNSSAERMRKHWHTDWPSVQGAWTPFTHQHPKLLGASFPNAELAESLDREQSATEKLLELFKKQQLSDGEDKPIDKVTQ